MSIVGSLFWNLLCVAALKPRALLSVYWFSKWGPSWNLSAVETFFVLMGTRTTKKGSSSKTTYWVCTRKQECKSSVVTEGKTATVLKTGEHTHGLDQEDIEAKRLCIRWKHLQFSIAKRARRSWLVELCGMCLPHRECLRRSLIVQHCSALSTGCAKLHCIQIRDQSQI